MKAVRRPWTQYTKFHTTEQIYKFRIKQEIKRNGKYKKDMNLKLQILCLMYIIFDKHFIVETFYAIILQRNSITTWADRKIDLHLYFILFFENCKCIKGVTLCIKLVEEKKTLNCSKIFQSIKQKLLKFQLSKDMK